MRQPTVKQRGRPKWKYNKRRSPRTSVQFRRLFRQTKAVVRKAQYPSLMTTLEAAKITAGALSLVSKMFDTITLRVKMRLELMNWCDDIALRTLLLHEYSHGGVMHMLEKVCAPRKEMDRVVPLHGMEFKKQMHRYGYGWRFLSRYLKRYKVVDHLQQGIVGGVSVATKEMK